MKNVLYRPSWQKLRVSCLAANHPQGGFMTTEGTNDNLRRLNQYLFNDDQGQLIESQAMGWSEPSWEFQCRVWRVLNLLNATRMGYSGQGRSETEMDQAVRIYRDSLQPHYAGGTVVKAGNAWKWDVVQRELEVLWANERYWFTAIMSDLKARAYRTQRKQGQADITGTRGELVTFLNMMTAVNLH